LERNCCGVSILSCKTEIGRFNAEKRYRQVWSSYQIVLNNCKILPVDTLEFSWDLNSHILLWSKPWYLYQHLKENRWLQNDRAITIKVTYYIFNISDRQQSVVTSWNQCWLFIFLYHGQCSYVMSVSSCWIRSAPRFASILEMSIIWKWIGIIRNVL
jgi:hypothetical protein